MSDRHHVLLIGFTDAAACRLAYEDAKHLPGLRQAAVLERSADGIIDVPESHTRGAGVPTVGGGMVGGLVGLLAGPIGALLGFAAGAAIGNAAEQNWERDGGAGLILLSAQVQDGTAMLVVDITESDPGPADQLAADHGGHLERRAAEDFAEEVRKAREAAEQTPPEGE
ncbi:histidine kinase [Kitasatospora sp. NPDC048365]|uniref:histidine kinase n=1 Tax=Kitasatospora sp. NPDC048365 TaxID=3364050 RepID=UPI00371FCBDB